MGRYLIIFTVLLGVSQVYGFQGYITLTHDGPTVEGGSITFVADLFNYDGSRPSGTFSYTWKDNGVPGHKHESEETESTTNIYKVDYPAGNYSAGEYSMEVKVSERFLLVWIFQGSQHKLFEITSRLNGNLTISQSNHTLQNAYVSSAVESKIEINLRKGDVDYIRSKATEVSTFWFIDCKYYGQSSDFVFKYNFTKPNEERSIEALVVASYEPPTTTTVAPTTTSTTTTTSAPSNVTTLKPATTTTIKPPVTTTLKPSIQTNTSTAVLEAKNFSFPYVCVNTSMVPPDPKKTYGYFRRSVQVKAPIKNVTVDGTNWIKRWDMLNLSVTCHGSGPFTKCLEFHRGTYNVTGNETCVNGAPLPSCDFSIIHFFLDANVYTIVIILENSVSKVVYPLKINIYEEKSKPQLSVIVVPVSCSLVAVVLIVFGVAYYVQSRSKFTVEVADFDFGQNNPDMEYKTFTERLRDSFHSTGYKQLNNPSTSEN